MQTEFYVMIFILSIAATFITIKFVIKKSKEKKYKDWDVGFLVPDLARKEKPLVPRLGGLGILSGFIFAALVSIAFLDPLFYTELFAVLTMILLIGIMAFFSDIIKISDGLRTAIPFIAAIPLMATSIGVTTVALPFIGIVDFGIYYSLILVPIGVIACTNLFNMLAGHNGLEAGTVSVAAASILAAFIIRQSIAPQFPFIVPAILLVALLGATLCFLYFNWYPARVFPGDTGTYVMAAVIVGAVIVGNIEKVGVIALMPQIIEFFLKARSRFKAENFGKLDKKGRLHYDGKIYSLTHLIMKYRKPTEKQLTLYLIGLQIIFGILAVSSLFW